MIKLPTITKVTAKYVDNNSTYVHSSLTAYTNWGQSKNLWIKFWFETAL